MAIHRNILSDLTIFVLLFSTSAKGRSLQVKAVSDSYTTNYHDVLGLNMLVTAFPLLQEDTTDPCVAPVWSWIECSSDSTPRVIALDLTTHLLVGQLPDFSSMDALQRIDLSGNGLYGPIPSFLGTFPDLQELNLADNLFYGIVPDSLACNNNLQLTLTGNSGLTLSSKCSTNSPADSFSGSSNSGGGGDIYTVPASRSRTKKKSNLPGILGGSISAFVIFWAAVGGYAIHRHKAKTAAAIAQAKGPTEQTAGIPMDEIPMNARATTNMSP